MTDATKPFHVDASMDEKLAELFNEQKVRNAQRRSENATTFSSFAQAEADEPRGRFSQIENSNVVGATPLPEYPAGPSWSADATGVEPPLGYRIDEQAACGEPWEIQKSLASASLYSSSPDADAEEGGAVEIETRSRPASPKTPIGRGIAEASDPISARSAEAPTSENSAQRLSEPPAKPQPTKRRGL